MASQNSRSVTIKFSAALRLSSLCSSHALQGAAGAWTMSKRTPHFFSSGYASQGAAGARTMSKRTPHTPSHFLQHNPRHDHDGDGDGDGDDDGDSDGDGDGEEEEE